MHPNVARLAVRYDELYTRWRAGQLSGEQARALMLDLSERDDQGVRWGIDPDTGRFVRMTAFGELEFDTPPASGVLTPDAFSYSGQARSDDPSLRLQLFSDDSMQVAPAPRVVSRSGAGAGPWWTRRKVVVAGALAAVAAAGVWVLF